MKGPGEEVIWVDRFWERMREGRKGREREREREREVFSLGKMGKERE